MAIAGLHAFVSLGNPLGIIEDDAVHILLARSLRQGTFALPDASGVPITDPWPGLAAVLMLPVWHLEPRWGFFRAFELLFAAAGLAATYFLARRLLPKIAAILAVLLTALNPTLLSYAGLLNVDILLMALAAALLLILELEDSPRNRALLIGLSMLAALLKPQGALLVLCLGAGVFHHHSTRRGFSFLGISLTPLALWLLRNHWAAGLWSGYAVNWGAQASRLAEPAELARHAVSLLAGMFGEGIVGLSSGSLTLRAAAGLVAIILMGRGAVRALRDRGSPSLFVMAAFCILITALHLTWLSVSPRYVLCFLPFAWIMIILGVLPKNASPVPPWAAVILLAGNALYQDAGHWLSSSHRPRTFQPETMDWIKTHTPPSARIQSLRYNALLLLTGRSSLPPTLDSRSTGDWFAAARANGIDYLYVESEFRPGGFLAAGAQFTARNLSSWASENPCVSLEREFPREGTAIYRLLDRPTQEAQKVSKSAGGGASKAAGFPVPGCVSSIR